MKNAFRVAFLTVLIVTVNGCLGDQFSWTNPVNDLEFRDTHIIPDNGKFYAVGTCEPVWGGPNPGVKLYSSDDLVNWKFEHLLIDAFALDSNVWYRDRFWAPELRKIGDTYYLTFNCQNNSGSYADPDMKHFHAPGIATAKNINGPYTVRTPDEPLVPFPSNDVTLFHDDDGKVYAFFNNGWTNIHRIFV
ncbi:MAG: family 43 glycosylhydrolase, partial [Bacteroidales bacterium]|nr:family 43 glycosylhydrolase [Bacteroidales bacterium]